MITNMVPSNAPTHAAANRSLFFMVFILLTVVIVVATHRMILRFLCLRLLELVTYRSVIVFELSCFLLLLFSLKF